MEIKEFLKKGILSVRSYNVCKDNEIDTLFDLKKYYFVHKSFERLRNCGRKSNEELIVICNSFQEINFDKKELELQKEHPLKQILSVLTRVQREVINSFILINANNLNVRSKNALSLYLNGNLKIKNFVEKIFLCESFIVKNMRNIGDTNVSELETYFSKIKDFLIVVSDLKNEKHLISLKNNFLIQRTFSISEIPSEILESESIFLLTDFLLNQNALFNDTTTEIVKKSLKTYQNQKVLSLEEIGKEVNLTKERVRQIKVKSIKELFTKLLFIQNFNEDLFQNYNIDVSSNQLEINTDIVEIINKTNNINFSKEFITYILHSFLNKNFFLIGDVEDVLDLNPSNSNKKYNWKNFYLIKRVLDNEINFNAFAYDIENRISKRIKESYAFNFKSYLSRFLINNNISILNLIFPIAENVINEEFNLYLDLNENIIFKRNTKKQSYEYAYEALKLIDKPSKVMDVFKKVIELYPNYVTDEAKIRSSMKRTNGFIPVGRKSVFGLKKWEEEKEDFKGGTIKDVIIEFLEDKDHPQHIATVINHLNSYRENKDSKSVLSNLKLDPTKRFLIFNQNFIGLKINESQYSNKFEKLPVQLGKSIIRKHKKGASIDEIQIYLNESFNLSLEESELILNNLEYFNENKRN